MNRQHATTPNLSALLGALTATQPWRTQAACKHAIEGGQADPGDWFPKRGETVRILRAKAICAGCPVRLTCLEEYLWEEFGIWGGETEKGRKAIRNGRKGVA